MLKIENLHFNYGGSSRDVLRGANLELSEGQVGILLGKNGSGKTTLFKSLLGIVKPKKGSITFHGENLLKLNRLQRARRIAYVPQDIQFGDLSVFDSVLMGRISYFGIRAGKEDLESVEQLLKDMGLMELAHRNVTELSGGERQKIAIARAMAQEPQLMVFDEPTGNLDIQSEQLIIREAKKLAQQKNIAILASLHDLNQALALGDTFFFLKDGVVKYAGGKEIFTPEVIKDIFDADVELLKMDGRTVIVNKF